MTDLDGVNYLINLKYLKFEINNFVIPGIGEKKSLDELTCSGNNSIFKLALILNKNSLL